MASIANTPLSARRDGNFGSLLKGGASLLAVCAFAAATPAFAQDAQGGTTPQGTQGGTAAQSGPGAAANVQQSGNASPDGPAANSPAPGAGDQGAIVVTGIRQSLQNSQNIKRNSDTVVDVITAQDIGALPDRSVTEALQRVPGVTMNRFAGANDPDHFSAEGSGVVVRGLTYVRSEFNARDTFSTGVYGQAINFQDVPAELLGSVEVFKEETADRIEGGLSGTINMNLRLPFDHKGLHVGFDAEGTYGDFRKKWSPVGSLLVSDTWDTGIGRIGLLGAVSYSKLFTRADGVQVSNFQTRDGTFVVNSDTTSSTNIICRVPLPGTTDATSGTNWINGFQGGTGSPPGTGGTAVAGPGVLGGSCNGGPQGNGPDSLYDNAGTRYAPIGGQFRTQDFDRIRRGYAGAFQWESNDRRAHLTAQFLRSHATENWSEHTFEAGSDLSEYNTFPAGCLPNGAGPIGGVFPNQAQQPIAQCKVGPNGTIQGASGTQWQSYPNGATFPNYQYDSTGLFESGYITLPIGGWRGNPNGGEVGDNVPAGGMENTLGYRSVSDSNTVQDQSINFKFSPTPHWDINLDGQYVRAQHDQLDFTEDGGSFSDQEIDLTGQYPQITPHKPLTLTNTWAQAPTATLKNEPDATYFADPHSTFWRSAMDHIEHSRGHEWAFQGDVSYNFLDSVPFLKQLKFGARYADREQDVKYTTYNWGSLSEVWSGQAVFMDQVGVPQNATSLYTFNNFFRGQANGPPATNYYNGNLINGYNQAVAFFESVQAYAQAHGGGGATSWVPLAGRAGVVPGTPFLPSEIQHVGQKTDDAYAMLRFGQDEPIFGDVRLDGNIGVRFVHDDVLSAGNIGAPSKQSLGIDQPFAVRCAPGTIPPPPAPQTVQVPGVCAIGAPAYAQLQAFATGQTAPQSVVNKYDRWLPSVNLKFGIGRDLIFRLAASRDYARPALSDIRNYLNFNLQNDGTFETQAGNPNLKPITSDNFDATLEWYFAGSRLGAITVDAFYKNIHNYIYNTTHNASFTSAGVTETFASRGPANYGGTGKVKGFEVNYNQVYDFLPSIFSGFGLSANFTYVASKGVPNAFLAGGTAGFNISPLGAPGNLPLTQLSKYSFNIQPFFEKGPVSLRLAYNWRSKFLLTESDVIFPYDPIWNAATGTLDASIFYSLNKYFKVGVQAQNLTNEVTKTLQQYTPDGRLAPRSYFMNDRRYSFILRGSF
jgi:TonB-dependent receptor